LRSPSRRSSAAASRTKPRVSRRRRASAAGSWRRRLGSSIVGASEVAERGIIACRVHVCPAHAWQNRAKPPDAPRMPEASRRSALPLPTGRGWWIVAAGLALGLVAFLAIWLSQRGDDALYRADQQPPAAAPPVFSPLPVPPAPGEVDVDEPIPAGPASGARLEEPERPAARPAATGPAAPGSLSASAPVPVRAPGPDYPRGALRRGESGEVLLRIHVDADGRPERIEVASSSGFRELDRAAERAVRRWRF